MKVMIHIGLDVHNDSIAAKRIRKPAASAWLAPVVDAKHKLIAAADVTHEATEWSLITLAYNLKRVFNLVSLPKLIQAVA